MSLMELPYELLLMIVEDRWTLCALARTNKHLYHLCNGILYDYNARFGKSSALLWAALTGNLATAKLSLMNGGNVNTQGVRKKTPLALAVMKHDFCMMELLLKHGADPRVPDNGGRTPLHFL
jgi:ankyrin repeat protein